MRFARPLLVLAATFLFALPAAGAPAVAPAPVKQLQARRMMSEPMRERAERRERLRELRRLAKRMRAEGRTTLRVRGERAKPWVEDEDVRSGLTPGPARVARPLASGAVTGPPRPNVRCNNTLGDGALDGQCETSIATWNNYMVAAWNDGTGFTDGSNQTQGWATSTDGGVTWVDQGTFPRPAPYTSTWVWSSDPVLAVNPATGAFYFAALGDASPTLSAAAVLKGRFNGSAFTWGTLSVPTAVSNSTDFIDKEWIAVDPASGRVLLSYTQFVGNVDVIKFQSADSALASWSTPRTMSVSGEEGWVQGSRPIAGPGGVWYVVYYLIGPVDADYYRICRSTDGGSTWSAVNDAVSFYSNFGSGAPGFNREMGIEFPSIAVDRSGGAHDGRLYLSWAESLNWYDDAVFAGNGGTKGETEPDDRFDQAVPLALGQTASGSVDASSDIYDWWAIPLSGGQSVVVVADTVASGLTLYLRAYGPDGATRLAFATASSTDITAGFHPVFVFSAPTSGTYYLRVAAFLGRGVYRVQTGPASRTTERGRDQRDVFVATSDNGGVTWSSPVRVNSEAAGYDDWLPEVAVAPDGQAYCAWYDFRDAPAATGGGESNVYLARSSDGGATWSELGATSDARTAWTTVQTNIIPNQGDYLSLFAGDAGVTAAWSDGRGGTPDVYMSHWKLSEASTLPALVSATVSNGAVQLLWSVGAPAGFAATLYRRVGASATFDSIPPTLLSDANGHLSYHDTGVEVGQTYTYRLGVVQNGNENFYGQVTLTVPGTLALAGAWPNPAGPGALIAFTLIGDSPATLDLLDLNGRRVSSRDVGSLGAGAHTLPLTAGARLRPGIYFARLTQSGRSVTRRVAVL